MSDQVRLSHLREGGHMEENPLLLPWRVGHKIGRTVYAVIGPEAADDDVVLGMMDTCELAAEVVAAHNHRLRERGVL